MLGTDVSRGLRTDEARFRLAQHGENRLETRGGTSAAKVFLRQFRGTLILVLIAAAVISGALGEIVDAVAIGAIVLLNATFGFWQEFRAERAMSALAQLTVPVVRVRRDGRVREISARELVPGDIVLLEAGTVVPADGRLTEAASLRVQEAALTGESQAVEKNVWSVYEEFTPLAERSNMVFSGTTVVYGRGEAIVTATGMGTELGRVATLLRDVEDEPLPLQKRVEVLGRMLAALALVVVIAVVILGRHEEPKQLFLTAVSLAVAAVPEGLPAVVTISLALGAQRMLRRNALIRKLAAVETLGSVTVICTDKTGTLTHNRMAVRAWWIPGREVVDRTAGDEGDLLEGEAVGDSELRLLLAAAALASDAELEPDLDENGAPIALGDPTETALVRAAARMGLRKPELESAWMRVGEAPFDSVRKRMATLHRPVRPEGTPFAEASLVSGPGQRQAGGIEALVVAKGAVESILDVSTRILRGGSAKLLEEAGRAEVLEAQEELAGRGMRVLAVAARVARSGTVVWSAGVPGLEKDLVLVGLVGLIDPPRPEAREAVLSCLTAGIRPVMVTGDHPLTASHVAASVGLMTQDRTMTGAELNPLSPAEIARAAGEVNVFARVSPHDKLRLVEALQSRGEIVAMTGDGVNDAPALKQADIGVAMGITGTDVSKEAADIVLRDDNFATIVSAVEEGRVLFDNIRKFVVYLLGCNTGEIAVMLFGPMVGIPLPLLPLQILWMNLVTDGLPALALGLEPPEENVMRRPPRAPSEGLLTRGALVRILRLGALVGGASLAAGWWYWHQSDPAWQTVVFTSLTFAQMALALSVRSSRAPFGRAGVHKNPRLVGGIVLTIGLQLMILYTPFFQRIFDTKPLDLERLGMCVAVAVVVVVLVELGKALRRR